MLRPLLGAVGHRDPSGPTQRGLSGGPGGCGGNGRTGGQRRHRTGCAAQRGTILLSDFASCARFDTRRGRVGDGCFLFSFCASLVIRFSSRFVFCTPIPTSLSFLFLFSPSISLSFFFPFDFPLISPMKIASLRGRPALICTVQLKTVRGSFFLAAKIDESPSVSEFSSATLNHARRELRNKLPRMIQRQTRKLDRIFAKCCKPHRIQSASICLILYRQTDQSARRRIKGKL